MLVRVSNCSRGFQTIEIRNTEQGTGAYIITYGTWDEQTKELEVEENFVFLANIDKDVHPLFLNLMEMWCCLMLQTLTRNALQVYLPNGVVCPNAGGHLNVALPLHQSIRGQTVRDKLSLDIYHSPDPSIRAYYASLRQNSYNLKLSPNPLLREIYRRKMHAAHFKKASIRRQKSAQAIIAGKMVTIKRNEWRQTFSISHWGFSISRKVVHLNDGDTLHVECELLPDSHDNCYARMSQACDPAARLGIRLTGKDKYGSFVDIWLSTLGIQQVFKMNTFVDMLEGRNIYNPADSERRWIPRAKAKATYTADIL